MSKRQTRRTVSLRAEVYERLRDHCGLHGHAMCALAEEAIMALLDRHGAPKVDRKTALAQLEDRKARQQRERMERDVREQAELLRSFGQRVTF